jgi:hypothetical protein
MIRQVTRWFTWNLTVRRAGVRTYSNMVGFY